MRTGWRRTSREVMRPCMIMSYGNYKANDPEKLTSLRTVATLRGRRSQDCASLAPVKLASTFLPLRIARSSRATYD
jgi:hypothetical protein